MNVKWSCRKLLCTALLLAVSQSHAMNWFGWGSKTQEPSKEEKKSEGVQPGEQETFDSEIDAVLVSPEVQPVQNQPDVVIEASSAPLNLTVLTDNDSVESVEQPDQVPNDEIVREIVKILDDSISVHMDVKKTVTIFNSDVVQKVPVTVKPSPEPITFETDETMGEIVKFLDDIISVNMDVVKTVTTFERSTPAPEPFNAYAVYTKALQDYLTSFSSRTLDIQDINIDGKQGWTLTAFGVLKHILGNSYYGALHSALLDQIRKNFCTLNTSWCLPHRIWVEKGDQPDVDALLKDQYESIPDYYCTVYFPTEQALKAQHYPMETVLVSKNNSRAMESWCKSMVNLLPKEERKKEFLQQELQYLGLLHGAEMVHAFQYSPDGDTLTKVAAGLFYVLNDTAIIPMVCASSSEARSALIQATVCKLQENSKLKHIIAMPPISHENIYKNIGFKVQQQLFGYKSKK